MSPQFVDLNNDGDVDIVAGTFDGSPHVAYGSTKGFAQPQHITDASGNRVILDQYWDYDAKKWVHGDQKDTRHCTSVFAFDWDGDDDFDLLLGDYKSGYVLLVLNLGSNTSPQFSTEKTPVRANGKTIKLRQRIATLRMLDWDGDGRDDLLCGTFGSPMLRATGGEIHWFRNTGTATTPRFAKATVLVKYALPSPGIMAGPGAGYYFDATDYDGDGDLDFLIGGKTTVLPKEPELTATEQARVKQLQNELQLARKGRTNIRKAAKAVARDENGRPDNKKLTEELAKHKAELDALAKRADAARLELNVLSPARRVENLVWLYRNRSNSKQAGPTIERNR